MSFSVLNAPNSDIHSARKGRATRPRGKIGPGAVVEPIAELTPEQWAEIERRIQETGSPREPEDDRALARSLGVSLMLGLTLTGIMGYGLYRVLT